MNDDVDHQGLPLDPVLREKMIEDLARHAAEKVRNQLEHMPYQQVLESIIMPFDKFLTEAEKIEQRRAFAAGATEARRRDATARDIERHCREMKARGVWERGSAKKVADYFGCKVRHVQNIVSKL